MVSGVAFIGVKVLSFANSHFLRPILVSTPTKQSTTGPYDQRIVECATSINAERRVCGGAGKFPQQSCYSIAENTILHLHHGQSLYTQHCDVYVYATDTGASTDSSQTIMYCHKCRRIKSLQNVLLMPVKNGSQMIWTRIRSFYSENVWYALSAFVLLVVKSNTAFCIHFRRPIVVATKVGRLLV